MVRNMEASALRSFSVHPAYIDSYAEALEFVAQYELRPRGDGTTYLSYEVELVPCPIFPLPLVERKIRKEVPKMLSAVSVAAVARTS